MDVFRSITVTESVLEELLDLEADIKPKVKRIAEIKDWCKQVGSFNTDHYICLIKDQERTGLVSLEKAVGKLGRTILEETGCIQTTSFQTVHIAAKILK